MAKPIFVPEEEQEILMKAFERIIRGKIYGKIAIEKSFAKDKRNATVKFTQQAWIKTQALVQEFETEVQWHGLTRRISENEFEIYDIIVPPHKVTGSTVVSDPDKFVEWYNELSDEQAHDLRMHGHSHVRMGCTPSATDDTYRKELVSQLPKPAEDEDSFYIFLIFNKFGAHTGEIYDLKYDALYDTSEINIEVGFEDGTTLDDFLKEAKSLAVREIASKSYNDYKSKLPAATSKKDVTTKKGSESKAKSTKSKVDDDDDYDYYEELAKRYGVSQDEYGYDGYPYYDNYYGRG